MRKVGDNLIRHEYAKYRHTIRIWRVLYLAITAGINVTDVVSAVIVSAVDEHSV